MLDEASNLFAMGSNIFGQLGIHNKAVLEHLYHPLTKKKLFYTNEPLSI